MHRVPTTIIALLLILMSACKTSQPVRPTEQYEALFEERSSTLNLPVDINVRDLEHSLNQQLQGVLYEDKDIRDGDKMMIRAEKREDIRLAVDSNLIKYRVPLSLWIKYDLGISKVEAEGEIALRFKTAFNLSRDWNITTLTEIEGYDWLQKPRLKMGMVNLPIGFIADLVLKNSKSVITRNVDQTIREQFNLREMVQDAWKQMFKPILVSEEYHTWLTVNPQLIGMTPLQMKGNKIAGTIFVESLPRVRIGQQPMEITPPPLPSLQIKEATGDDFNLHLNTEITFEEAERLAKSQMVGETFSQGKRSVSIEDIELYGQGNKIVVNTVLKGSYNGSIYLVGKPVYNPRRNTIDVESLDYTLDTRNFLVRSAGWLLKSTIKNKLEDNLNFLLDYNLKEMQAQFQEQLHNYKISENVTLDGELRELGIQNAYLSQESIIVDLALKGKLYISVRGLN
ncbi:MAG: DUF4403 family protein [Lewinellaceae bacterium]|nr:DUF4403 family protein [Lewinellaceae bacterium]